jgi:hypothetical protein
MTDGFEHPAHLSIAPFPDRDLDEAVAVAPPLVDEDDVGRHRAMAVERDARPEPLQRLFVWHARYLGLVGALDSMTRVRELRGELAIVGQQEQPLGVVVEPADGVDILAHR